MYIDEESKNLDVYVVGHISKQDFINKSVYNPIFYCNTVDEINLIPPNDWYRNSKDTPSIVYW